MIVESAVSISDMPAVNRAGKIRMDQIAMRRLSGGEAEQADFRCSVEAEPEQKPERVSVPTAPDQRNERAQQARDRAALRKAVIVIFGRHPAGLSDGAQ